MYCHETSSLHFQTMQNNMLRVIHGLRMVQCVNMQRLREKIKMMSGNQMAVYHTIIEVLINNSSLEQIQNKHQERPSLRGNANNFIRVPEKPMKRCTGLTYTESLHNAIFDNCKNSH